MQTNNKLREALEKCANWGEQIDCQLGSSDATVYAFRNERCLAHNISECARAALAAPPRNCDVYDAKTAEKEFVRQTGSKSIRSKSVRWLYAPATEKEGDNSEQK